jgi:hypothetical protein
MEDPVNESDFGDGSLMKQGFTFLWMGWQWDVPNGAMGMDMPIASDGGRPITGRVRAKTGTRSTLRFRCPTRSSRRHYQSATTSIKSACQTRQMLAEEKRRRVGLR